MEDIEWNVVNEGQLLDAMVGHKPIGVNKYFQMALICDKFADNLRKDVNPQKIWAHLDTMYNLEALDENEAIPFPNSETEFSLPEAEFGELLTKKEDEDKKSIKRDVESKPKNMATTRRDSKDSKDKTPVNSNKKEGKKESGRGTGLKGRPPNSAKNKNADETPKPTKRTRGSLKSNDDSGSSGKSSPITVTPTAGKRRRVL